MSTVNLAIEWTVALHLEQRILILLVRLRVNLLCELDDGFEVTSGIFLSFL